MRYFETLADRVESLTSSRSFSQAALQALLEMPPNAIGRDAILDWVLQAQVLPKQSDLAGAFGDPPITVVHREGFHIQVLFWRDGSAAIHHHAFAGAFCVLEGASIHTRYTFDVQDSVADNFKLGRLEHQRSECLSAGDCREILPGASFIHSVFHLDHPSVSIVIRTHFDSVGAPQLAYTPSLAYDPFEQCPKRVRKLQVIALVAETKPQYLQNAITDVLRMSDLATSYAVLDAHVRRLGSLSGLRPLLDVVAKTHGEQSKCFAESLSYVLREGNIVSRRQIVRSREHRQLLALLLTTPTRVEILELVRSLYPADEPARKIKSWLTELAAEPVSPEWGPNALGIRLDDTSLEFLGAILEGCTIEAAEAGCKNTGPAAIAALTLPRSAILSPLFH